MKLRKILISHRGWRRDNGMVHTIVGFVLTRASEESVYYDFSMLENFFSILSYHDRPKQLQFYRFYRRHRGRGTTPRYSPTSNAAERRLQIEK